MTEEKHGEDAPVFQVPPFSELVRFSNIMLPNELLKRSTHSPNLIRSASRCLRALGVAQRGTLGPNCISIN